MNWLLGFLFLRRVFHNPPKKPEKDKTVTITIERGKQKKGKRNGRR